MEEEEGYVTCAGLGEGDEGVEMMEQLWERRVSKKSTAEWVVVGFIPKASLDLEPPRTLRKTAYAPIPRTPAKTMRARVTSENLGIASWIVEIGLTTSSGESSFVNASLKVNAVNMRTPISETVIERGFFCPIGCVSRLRSQPYVDRTSDQRNLGFVAMNVFTMSGEPANF